jgi:hypothetical protein
MQYVFLGAAGEGGRGSKVRMAAKVTEPSTGLKLAVLTNAPGKGGHRQPASVSSALTC